VSTPAPRERPSGDTLRRVDPTPPLPKLPSDLTDPVAHRRGITVRGW